MATADKHHVSEEEEKFLRMKLLLTGISPRAVRVLFDKEFHPFCLKACFKKEHDTLLDLKKRNIINKQQWKLLFPSGGDPKSKSFDVSLMVTLLRNLAKLAPPTGGYDDLPLRTDTTTTADLARIKYYRNELGHNTTAKIESAYFIKAWEDISEAVRRLGGHDMGEECKQLRVKRLDHSTVPCNERDRMIKILDQWRKNDVNFVETSAAKKVLKCIQENSCVTITASSGVGKTATLRHVVLKMKDEGYDVLRVTNPHDIVRFHNPNKKTLFIIDDFCGTYSINQSDLNNWGPVKTEVEELIQNKLTKISVACRLQVYNDEKFKSLSMFRTNVCNLLSEDLSLSRTEKQLIAEMYLKTKSSKIIQYSDRFDCFPLLCKLYHDNPTLNITDFFQNPFSVYEADIEQLKTNGLFSKYCALALCVMFNNELKKEVLTDELDTVTRTIIDNTFEECRLDKGTSRKTIKAELHSLEHTYIKIDQGVYKTVHDKLFDCLSCYFGKNMIQCIIRNAHCEFISDRFLLLEDKNMDQFVTIVPPKYHEMYIQRMVNDWSNGEVVTVFCNKNMNNPTFRDRYMCYLNSLDQSYQKQLAHTRDIMFEDTALLQCCFIGDIPLIQWCLHHCVDVNMCNGDKISPLFMACQEGHTDIVKLLLDTKADIDTCTDDKLSPLFSACQNNHVNIVKLLLDYKADIDKCTDEETSPLYIACAKGYKEIVQLLLDHKADINKCRDNGSFPLYIACEEGNKDIVQLLLDNKANINKCTDDETSPLYIACQEDHVDIVKLLVENKADINKCTDDEASPLYVACEKGNKDIVQLLLDNKANINKCLDDETSPLYIACEKKHLDIVKLLLDNKADINKCKKDESFPLFIACQEGHADIVKLLVDNKADINKCTDNDASPLHIACEEDHLDIVKLLLDNKADINKCMENESSPLSIACQEGHADIVKLLLDNKADINRCTYNEESPLYIACENGNKDIVQLLLDNKADINKCNDKGTSPLNIARQNNHVNVVKLLVDYKADIDM